MRRLASLGSLLVLGAALVAPAPCPARAEEGEFKAKLAIVRADKALDFWYRTAQSSGPTLSIVERVNPLDSVLLLVIFDGIGDAGGGKGKVTLALSTIDAAGETHVLAQDIPAWEGTPPSKGILVMSRAVPEFSFDEKEPMGTSTIVAEARDEGSGRTARSEAQLELVPWSYGDVPADHAACEEWMWEYYRAPKPAQAVRAYLEYADLENRDGKSVNYAVLGFFRTVFQDAPWLVAHLAARFDPANKEQAKKIVVMLHLLGHDERIQKLSFPDGKVHGMPGELAQMVLPDPYADTIGSAELDLLWGEFLASGRYKPVRQIISVLGLAPFEDEIKAYPKSKKTDEDKQRLLKGVTFQAARWSLDSNMQRHPLVAGYARYAAENETLGQDERAQLEALLAKNGGAPAER